MTTSVIIIEKLPVFATVAPLLCRLVSEKELIWVMIYTNAESVSNKELTSQPFALKNNRKCCAVVTIRKMEKYISIM